MIHRTSTLAAAALALAGCVAAPTVENAGPYPSDYRAIVADYARHSFKDPGSIKDAAISDPAPGRTLSGTGWFVCLRANAKNSYGGYTGEQTDLVLIRDGQVIDEQGGALYGMCTGRRVYPFPEIDGRG